MKNRFVFLGFILVMSSLLSFNSFEAHACDCDGHDKEKSSEINLDRWMLDVAFGTQNHMNFTTGFHVATPHLFNFFKGGEVRLLFLGKIKDPDYIEEAAVWEYGALLELDHLVYRDSVYSYMRAGLTWVDPTSEIYTGSFTTLPIHFGINIITGKIEDRSSSLFIEYNIPFALSFNEDKSLLEKEFMSAAGFTLGLRTSF